MTERWRSLSLTLYALGDGRELAACDLSGATIVVTPEEGDILLACKEPLTLEEHAAAAARPEAGPLLERAAAADVLLSDEALLEPARSRPRPAPPAPSALGIVTRDRPRELARCLNSFRAPELVVCDDGDSPPQLPPGVRYAGPAEKSAFLDALASESGVSRATAAFALGDVGAPGFRAGGNRNALLLDLVDRLYLSVDDDVVGRLARPADLDARPVLGYESRHLETRIFPDRESALRAAPRADVDFLAAHGELLGRDLSAFPSLECGPIGASTARRLRRDGAFVAVTMSGLVGDCGVGSAAWLLLLDPTSTPALAGSDEIWARTTSSRELLRVARRPVLSDLPSLMTGACGYDGRSLLPPFAPFGRNEDGVFAFSLMRCVPGALIGHLPVAILHEPTGPRDYALPSGGRIGIGEFLVACMGSLESSPGIVPPEDHYRDLGRHLRELSAAPDADYDEYVRRLLWNRASGRIERLSSEKKENPGCPGRGFDLARAIEGAQAGLLKPDFAVPRDAPGADLAAQRAFAKSFMGRFGELLEAWPALVAAARRLSARGIRLSR